MKATRDKLHRMLAENEAMLRETKAADVQIEQARQKMVDETNRIIGEARPQVLIDPEARRRYQTAIFHRGMLNAAEGQ